MGNLRCVTPAIEPTTLSSITTATIITTDEAKDISGRQFLVGGNSVALLSWQVTPIAKRDLSEGIWGVEEIGEHIRNSKDNWPPVNPMRG